MPFKSKAQRKFLFSQEPEVAQEYASKTKKGAEGTKGAKLPEKIKKPKTKVKAKK